MFVANRRNDPLLAPVRTLVADLVHDGDVGDPDHRRDEADNHQQQSPEFTEVHSEREYGNAEHVGTTRQLQGRLK